MTIADTPFFRDNFPNITKSSMIGFDDMIRKMSNFGDIKVPGYPPYNIRKIDENKYVIEMAVAGFGKQDLEIELKEGVLTIKGNVTTNSNDSEYIFKGIADRSFSRRFTLADTVEVKNAELINGLLKVFLEKLIPENKKARKIDILDPFGIGEATKQLLQEGYKSTLGASKTE